MNEEVELYIEDAVEQMNKAIIHLENELLKIRAGKASPSMLNGIFVDYYGAKTPLTQVSNISTTDARTIMIQPWEKKMIDAIEKAIFASNIGLTPVNNGENIRLNVPALTEERRREIVKNVKHEGETAKVSIRNSRRDANEEIKKLQKNGVPEDDIKEAEDIIQKHTDNYSKKVEEILHKKELEVLSL